MACSRSGNAAMCDRGFSTLNKDIWYKSLTAKDPILFLLGHLLTLSVHRTGEYVDV